MGIKLVVNVVGITIVGILNYIFLIKVQENVIFEKVVPLAGVTINQWIDTFRSLAVIGIASSLLAALIWFGLGQWGFRVDTWDDTGKRPIWLILLLIPVITAVVLMFKTPEAQEGAMWAYFFHLLNGLLCYFLGTLLFSPSSFKFSPPLSKVFRRGW